MSRRQSGFTLIELIVVMAIIAALTGMTSVIMGIAQRHGKKTATQAILAKVDQATRLFRVDVGTYPWQTDLTNAHADPNLWTNNLGFRLAWNPASSAARTTYLDQVQTDLTAIHDRFVFVDGMSIPAVPTAGMNGTHAFRVGNHTTDLAFKTNILLAGNTLSAATSTFTTTDGQAAAVGSVSTLTGKAIVLTRMADEFTVYKYLGGQIPTTAPSGYDPVQPADKTIRPDLDERYTILSFKSGALTHSAYRYAPYNKAGTIYDDSRGPVLTSGTATAKGWRGDYLAGSLKQQVAPGSAGDIDPTGDVIIDAYKTPIVYISAFHPGVRGYSHAINVGGAGLTGLVNQRDYGMAPGQRSETGSLTSDIRTTSASAYIMEFELWSSGPDGRFHETRDHAANRDNIAIAPYTKALR